MPCGTLPALRRCYIDAGPRLVREAPEHTMTKSISGRFSHLAPRLDDDDDPESQGARFGQRRHPVVGLPVAEDPKDRRAALLSKLRSPVVNVIDIWTDGDGVILEPEGILIRWPRGEPLPELGQEVPARIVRVEHAEQKERLKTLLTGNILERCEATCHLPSRVVRTFYSASHANNMERAGRNLCPSIRAHVARLLKEGLSVSCNLLFKMARRRTEAAQWAVWRADG